MVPNTEIVLSSGTLTTTTSLAVIPGLTFNVQAGGTYKFEAYARYRVAVGSANSFVIGPAGSHTATALHWVSTIQNAVDGSANLKTMAAVAGNTNPAGATSATATATDLAAFVRGLVVVNAAGTFQIHARHTSTNACTVQS